MPEETLGEKMGTLIIGILILSGGIGLMYTQIALWDTWWGGWRICIFFALIGMAMGTVLIIVALIPNKMKEKWKKETEKRQKILERSKCTQCGQQLRYIEVNDKWWCDRCLMYGVVDLPPQDFKDQPDPYEEIKRLKKLLDMGEISQEEYNIKKKQLLEI